MNPSSSAAPHAGPLVLVSGALSGTGRAEEVAATIVFLADGTAGHIAGEIVTIDGGFAAG